MPMPDKVPDAVIDSIARSHVRWIPQGECPLHDRRWKGQNVYDATFETTPCTCAVSMARFQDILKALRWSFDHYSFDYAGMYVGVELDGYMHT